MTPEHSSSYPRFYYRFGLSLMLVFGLGFVVALSNSPKLGANPKPPTGYHWNLLFSDDFKGNSLNRSLWVTCYDWYDSVNGGCTNSGNHELEWYQSQQVKVQNGTAILTAKQFPTDVWVDGVKHTYPYVSGMISTGRESFYEEPKRSLGYGFYEAKMKIEGGRGIWPAFWLLPLDHSWPPEIDVMEALGHEPNRVRMTYHWVGADGNRAKSEVIFENGDFTKDWHTYGVNWQPGRIDWYVDGVLRASRENSDVTDKPMELIINLAVGGDFPGSPDESTPFPSTVKIDYVRGWWLEKD